MAVVGCGDNDARSSEESDTLSTEAPTTEYRGVENPIGNIPDTNETGAQPQTNYGDTAVDK